MLRSVLGKRWNGILICKVGVHQDSPSSFQAGLSSSTGREGGQIAKFESDQSDKEHQRANLAAAFEDKMQFS